MKEISYIHSEAYAAGELKHGTISLIEDGTLVIGCLTQPALYEKTVSNMVECKEPWRLSDGTDDDGRIIILRIRTLVTYIPKRQIHFTPPAVIPLQLMDIMCPWRC